MSFDDQVISVRREGIDEIRIQSRSSSPPAALKTEYHQQLEYLFGAIDQQAEEPGAGAPDDGIGSTDRAENKDAYEFRLFARPLKDSPQHHRPSIHQVTLRSPTPINREPGFLIARRPDSYYFTSTPNEALVAQYNVAAISGDDVVKQSKARWRGSELPWKVTVISSKDARIKKASTAFTTSESRTRRRRSGKKRRIAIRKKLQLKAAQDLALKQSQVEKEAAEKEKRTRRNREKKVKRKQKEKLKKTEQAQHSSP